jgi:hypothetical protein
MKSLNWSKGDYSSLINIYKTFNDFSEYTDEELVKNVNERLSALVSGIERMTKEELEQPDIANAIK